MGKNVQLSATKLIDKILKQQLIDIPNKDSYHKNVMETLFLHLCLSGRDVQGSPDQFTSSEHGKLCLAVRGNANKQKQTEFW